MWQGLTSEGIFLGLGETCEMSHKEGQQDRRSFSIRGWPLKDQLSLSLLYLSFLIYTSSLFFSFLLLHLNRLWAHYFECESAWCMLWKVQRCSISLIEYKVLIWSTRS